MPKAIIIGSASQTQKRDKQTHNQNNKAMLRAIT